MKETFVKALTTFFVAAGIFFLSLFPFVLLAGIIAGTAGAIFLGVNYGLAPFGAPALSYFQCLALTALLYVLKGIFTRAK